MRVFFYFHAMTVLYTIYYIHRDINSVSQGITYIMLSRISSDSIRIFNNYCRIFAIFGNFIFFFLQYANVKPLWKFRIGSEI